MTGWRRKFARLSGREVEVLRQTIDGLTSKEVGRRLAISPRTVDAHRAGILRKLGVSRLSEAVLPFCRLLEEQVPARRRGPF